MARGILRTVSAGGSACGSVLGVGAVGGVGAGVSDGGSEFADLAGLAIFAVFAALRARVGLGAGSAGAGSNGSSGSAGFALRAVVFLAATFLTADFFAAVFLAALLRAGVVLVVSCEIGRVSSLWCSLIRDGGLLAPGRGKKGVLWVELVEQRVVDFEVGEDVYRVRVFIELVVEFDDLAGDGEVGDDGGGLGEGDVFFGEEGESSAAEGVGDGAEFVGCGEDDVFVVVGPDVVGAGFDSGVHDVGFVDFRGAEADFAFAVELV